MKRRQKHTAKKGSRFSADDAELIGSFMDKRFPSGYVNANNLLAAATPKNSPIHRYFEWDNKKAANEYRLEQARRIIRSIIVNIDGHNVRKYVAPIFVEETEQTDYVDINIARNTPALWEQVLEQAMKEAILWRDRYRTYKELTPIFKGINQVEKTIRRKANAEKYENKKAKVASGS